MQQQAGEKYDPIRAHRRERGNGMKTVESAVCSVIALALALLPAVTAAQELPGNPSPSVKSFNLKKINKGGINNLPEGWVITGKRTSVAFYIESDETATNYEAYSLKISDKGNASAPNSFWTGPGQRLIEIAAVWIPAEEHGLVFLAYVTNSSEKQVNVVVAHFDAEGGIISGFRLLHTFNAPADTYFFFVSLGVALREGRVGVAAIAVSNEDGMYAPWGIRNSMGQFIEVDTKGKPKGKLTMKLPSAGSREWAWPFTPFWTGKKWLTPIECTYYALGSNSHYPDYYNPYGNGLYVMRAEVRNDKLSKIRLRRLISDNEHDVLTYRNPQFVVQANGEAPSGTKDSYLLLYSHRLLLPEENWKYDKYSYYFGMQAVDDKCKPVGGTIAVNLPTWTPGQPTQSNERLSATDRALSFPLTGDDGKIVVVMSRTTTWKNTTLYTYRSANLLELFSIDPATGEVETLAKRDPGWCGYMQRTAVRVFGGHITVFIPYIDYSTSTPTAFDYFSRF